MLLLTYGNLSIFEITNLEINRASSLYYEHGDTLNTMDTKLLEFFNLLSNRNLPVDSLEEYKEYLHILGKCFYLTAFPSDHLNLLKVIAKAKGIY